jgi:sugar/nucleoside kinase (ribokinase family)
VVTVGSAGCWYQSAGETVARHQPVFSVTAIDTTGCGDAFRGIYAAALTAGLPLYERVLHAAAGAAIVASRLFDDANRWPARDEIEAFLARRGRLD